MKRSATVISRGKGRNKPWWARLVYVDEATGKRRDRQGRAESYADAKEKAEQLAKEFDESQGRSIDAERMTFAELADLRKALLQGGRVPRRAQGGGRARPGYR